MFTRRFTDEKTYQVVEHCVGFDRVIPHDQHDYLKWCEANTPTIEAEGRFLSVVDGNLVIDPQKEVILAAEAAVQAAEIAAIEKKAQDIAAAKAQIVKIEADIDKASDITAMKAIVLDLVKQIKILTD
jgi:F0F1-type ATP synthase epsilon subunit